jgi:hypothetical protein
LRVKDQTGEKRQKHLQVKKWVLVEWVTWVVHFHQLVVM